MPLRRELFRKVTIIGVGLIGGSIGKAIKKNKLAREVVGLSQRHETLVAAVKNKAVDHAYHDIKKAVNNADLVILAAPVGIISGMLSMIGPHLKRNCIVTDVGSSKASIVAAAQEHLPSSVMFVGSHPLAGSEKKGVQYSTAELFEGATCIITPSEKTHKTAQEKIKRFWKQVGSVVKVMSPEEHDKILAYISHVPHVISYALMETIPDNCLGYAASGLKDATRIAASSPQMWNDICMGNSRNIINILDEYVKILSSIRKCISGLDQKSLTNHFQTAKTKRDKI